jgi:hypothetical protein
MRSVCSWRKFILSATTSQQHLFELSTPASTEQDKYHRGTKWVTTCQSLVCFKWSCICALKVSTHRPFFPSANSTASSILIRAVPSPCAATPQQTRTTRSTLTMSLATAGSTTLPLDLDIPTMTHPSSEISAATEQASPEDATLLGLPVELQKTIVEYVSRHK